jgi:hypothetical protein
LVLLTLWLLYEGIIRHKSYLRWLALLTYLGATLAHFAAVTLAPPLVIASAGLVWLRMSAARRSDVQFEANRTSDRESGQLDPAQDHGDSRSIWDGAKQPRLWLELAALAAILIIAFLVKRAGQPKGIEALDGTARHAVGGLVQVFKIYSDFSFNFYDGWQAIAPFYLTLPAVIFLPFALITAVALVSQIIKRSSAGGSSARPGAVWADWVSPAAFLSAILAITTLEMILLVSPDRRDDKYQFMLLPVLLLLGAVGMMLVGNWLLVAVSRRLGTASKSAADSGRALDGVFLSIIITIIIVGVTWSGVQTLLANTGDDYDRAFAFVREHWQDGDTILTGTPPAAAFYLGRSDFYSVQRQGGYDYRILTVNDRAVDRWLASPAIRTEADLNHVLDNHNVWLVLERWGLQREYYDPLFQQQLLAQTEYVAETQGIFILRSRANARPIQGEPAESVDAIFGDLVQLNGYTVETIGREQPLRLTLYWQAQAPLPEDYTVFVHLRQPAGGNVAQADHLPLGNLFPSSLWPVGESIRETSELEFPADLPSGDYELWAGLYLLETGERLPVRDDATGENAVYLGTIPVD